MTSSLSKYNGMRSASAQKKEIIMMIIIMIIIIVIITIIITVIVN